MRNRRRASGTVAAVLLVAGAVVVAPTATAAPRDYTAGAPGAGDPYFPYAGNGGYDVLSYDLDITYTPPASGAGAAHRAPHGGGRDHPRRHPGPGPLQSRPARHERRERHRRREVGDCRCATRAGRRGRRKRVLARPGQRGPRVGTDDPAPTEAQEGPSSPGDHHLRRRDDPADRHRGRPVWLGDHPRRRHGRRPARGIDDVVSRQRPPHRQGDLPVRDHRAGGQGRRRERAGRAQPDHQARLDDLVLEGARCPGQLPHNGLGGRLRVA